ncbi:zinc finger FYVE domain-containing protein 26 isoform X2 [Schistocerca gregaria]|uniref:zinc finger FYVE domain-containing protein 26 isoform X2 n=1 Tax=Schistocerca gregaria TaxID=7010 RepID=UPI00211E90F4|nr:zinc finger FYVE domain-containing protein 26 isoform X2 [Schistocerca gregaria]
MDQIHYLRLGLWNVAEGLYKYFIENDSSQDAKSQSRSYHWNVAVDPESNCFASPVVMTPWHQSWVSTWLISNETGACREMTTAVTDVRSLRKETEFHYILNILSPPPIILKELSHLYSQTLFADKIATPVQCFSMHAHKFLCDCLLKYPVLADFIIQQLMCIWSPYFNESDNELQDIYKECIDACIENMEKFNCDASNKTNNIPTSSHVIRTKIIESTSDSDNTASVLFFLVALWKVSAGKNELLVKHISGRLPPICERMVLAEREIYFSLIARNDVDQLKTFLDAENAFYRRIKTDSFHDIEHILNNLKIHDGTFSVKEIFIRMINIRRHWIEDIVDLVCQSTGKGNVSFSHLGTSLFMNNIYPLVILQIWEIFSGDSAVFHMIDRIIAKLQIDVDSVLGQIIVALQYQKTFSEWCKPYWQTDVISNTSLLLLAKNHSTLAVLHCITNLADTQWDKVKEMLCYRRCLSCSTSEQESEENLHQNWQVVTFDAFCALMTAFNVIHAGAEIEKMGKKMRRSSEHNFFAADTQQNCAHKCQPATKRQASLVDGDDDESINNATLQKTYDEEVTQRLVYIKEKVCGIYSLTYRAEIMENLFSMLLLGYEYMQDENSSLSGTEGTESVLKTEVSHHLEPSTSSENSERITDKLVSALNTGISQGAYDCSPPEMYYVPKPKQWLKQESLKSKRRCSLTEQSLNWSSYIADNGFVNNRCIVRDLLFCLKECLEETSTLYYKSRASGSRETLHCKAVPSSVTDETLPNRLHRLSQYISEAAWRLQVLTDDKFANNIGKSPEMYETSIVDSHFDWHYPCDDTTSASDSDTNENEVAARNKTRHRKFRRKTKSFTERSSENGSQSEPSGETSPSQSAVCFLPKSNKKRKSGRVLSPFGFINVMLSSHASLAIQCLSRGDLEKAKLVIKMNEAEEGPLAKEVRFTEAYSQLKLRLNANSLENQKARPGLNSTKPIASSEHAPVLHPPILQSIKETAGANIHTTAVTCEVEHFLSKVSPPVIEDLSKAVSVGNLQSSAALQCADCETAIVIIDMLLTLGSSQEHSVSMLAVAQSHCPMLKTEESKEASRNSTAGFVIFASAIGKTLDFLVSDRNSEDTSHSLSQFLPTDISLPVVISSALYPLNVNAAMELVNYWSSMQNALKEFCRCKDVDIRRNEMQEAIITRGNYLHNTSAHICFRKLMKMCNNNRTEKVTITQSEQPRYLQRFYSYLKFLTSLLVQKTPVKKETPRFSSYFDALHNGLMEYFGQLIFDLNIPPVALEHEASLIKHNLVDTVVHCCCPHITSANIVSTFQITCRTSWGMICLNENQMVEVSDTRNPELLVRSLLTDISQLLQGNSKINLKCGVLTRPVASEMVVDQRVRNVLSRTSGLSCVDLNLLSSVDEAMAFFLNVANLLWIHALLTLETDSEFTQPGTIITADMPKHSRKFGLLSKNPLERTIAMKSVGYKIGQLGFISLFTLQKWLLGEAACYPHMRSLKNFLSQDDTEAVEALKIPCDQRVLFSLANGQNFTPKIQVFLPETVDSQLDSGISEFLSFSATLHSNGCLIIPELLYFYLEASILNQEPESNAAIPSFNCNVSANYFSESDLEFGCNSKEKLQLLLEFLSDNVSGDFQIQLRSFAETLSSKDAALYQDCVSCSQPDYIFGIRFEYLSTTNAEEVLDSSSQCEENSCRKQAVTDTVLQFLERHCWLLAVIVDKLHKEVEEEKELVFETSSHQSISARTKSLENLLQSEWIGVLQPLFNSSPVLTALSSVIKPEVLWEYFHYLQRGRNWTQCATVLFCLPDSIMHNDPKLQLFRDMVLFELSSKLLSSDYPEPWLFAKYIGDISRQAKCVLKNVFQWPGNCCIEILKTVLGDSTRILDPQLKSLVTVRLQEIEVHDKVLRCFQNSDMKTWHDVCSLSERNPEFILDTLIEKREFQICRQWAEYHGIGMKMQHLIDSRFLLLYIHPEPSDFVSLKMLLQSLETSHAISICEDVLPHLKTIVGLKFVLEFLMECDLPKDTEYEYKLMLLSTDMLGALSAAECSALWGLVGHPHLIVEQLLMNTQLGALERAMVAAKPGLSSIPPSLPASEPSIDKLLRRYASKALDTRVGNAARLNTLGVPVEDRLLVSLASISSQSEEFVVPDRVPKKSEWVPDDEVIQCMSCHSVTFSMFNRRHHCRRCGRVVCATCSSRKMRVEGYGKVSVRVCDACYAQCQDAFEKTEAGSSEDGTFSSSLRAESVADFPWKLSVEEDYNSTVREEFSYEHAPSVSLCLAILKLHSEQEAHTRFLLDACDRMLHLLQPISPGTVNPEVDHTIVIRMVKSLAVAAKVTLAGRQTPELVGCCDQVLSCVDLLGMLAAAGQPCLPISTFWGHHKLRALRNHLLAEELWPLALEVSTKCGLDCTGVWAAWGKASLRAGFWNDAREHFAHCLKAGSRPPRDPPLLMEIISILEEVSLGHSNNSSESSIRQFPVDDNSVLHALASVDDISSGRYMLSAPASNTVFIGPKIGHKFYEESIFYLKQYGSHSGIISFYLRHDDETAALRYIQEQKVDPEIFLHIIYIPSLQKGTVSSLHGRMEWMDSSLLQWKPYLCHICHHLEKQGYLNVLYQLQIFMKDYVRAAMTCIRFYHAGARSYTDLANNVNYLEQANKHLQNSLSALQNTNVSTVAKSPPKRRLSNIQPPEEKVGLQLDSRELLRHIKTIERQLEITRFLHKCECDGRPVPLFVAAILGSGSSPPLLFGSSTERCQLAALLLLASPTIEEVFSLAQRIIDEYHLRPLTVYRIVCSKYAGDSSVNRIERLVNCIKNTENSERFAVCDEVLVLSVNKLVEKSSVTEAESLIKLITEPESKVSGYILCHQLKSAYLVAVKYNRVDDVLRIMQEAQKLENTAVHKICLKWLNQHGIFPSVGPV